VEQEQEQEHNLVLVLKRGVQKRSLFVCELRLKEYHMQAGIPQYEFWFIECKFHLLT